MLSFFNENKLQTLLTEFQKKYAFDNGLAYSPSYDEILSKISSFNKKPHWRETVFLTKYQSSSIIADYIDKRANYFSPDNCYSTFLVEQNKIAKCYKLFSMTHPMAALFCNRLIRVILIAELHSYIEGTTADELGIAHIDFKEHFNQEDFNELIVHQITHTLLFIDDFIEPQIEDSKKQLSIETRATHKRGGHCFPLYILFHSLCVGMEILNYRINFQVSGACVNYHPATGIAIRRCKEGALILNEYARLFTSKGKKILNLYTEMLQKFTSENLYVD